MKSVARGIGLSRRWGASLNGGVGARVQSAGFTVGESSPATHYKLRPETSGWRRHGAPSAGRKRGSDPMLETQHPEVCSLGEALQLGPLKFKARPPSHHGRPLLSGGKQRKKKGTGHPGKQSKHRASTAGGERCGLVGEVRQEVRGVDWWGK